MSAEVKRKRRAASPKWECTEPPELIPVPIDQRHFQQLVREVAEILYDTYMRLSAKQRQAQEELVQTKPVI